MSANSSTEDISFLVLKHWILEISPECDSGHQSNRTIDCLPYGKDALQGQPGSVQAQ